MFLYIFFKASFVRLTLKNKLNVKRGSDQNQMKKELLESIRKFLPGTK